MVWTCAICAKDHATKQYPSLPRLKVIFTEVEEETILVYLMAQHRQWQAHPSCMLQDPYSLFSGQYNHQYNSGNTWQGQPFANPTWKSQQYPTPP
jgi:hypothetical protein